MPFPQQIDGGARTPATGFGPRPQTSILDLAGAVATQAAEGIANPAHRPTGFGPTNFPALAQGPESSSYLPPEVVAGGLGAIRAYLGAEGFRRFLAHAAFWTVGPATVGNALAWGAGWVFDPVRFVYQHGLRTIIPGPPVRPIEGLFTPGVTDALALVYRMFDRDSVQRVQAGKIQFLRVQFQRLVRSGRLSINDPQVLDFERRFGIPVFPDVQRPDVSAANQAAMRVATETAYAIWALWQSQYAASSASGDQPTSAGPPGSADP